ncbi:indolepyruvate ferredoxin oxidoreductase family protein [Sphingobium sp. JS3065]|nr:indolepyruvate ferredoxin oxidoreductase family protein [Sphingobium sp. JS3065]
MIPDEPANPDTPRDMLSGTRALVEGMRLQAAVDRRRGLNTAGFVSGYRGSPLGNLDFELWSMREQLEADNILFKPGLNEDLAATACWGTQQASLMANPRQDGVFAFWYGKGPGVDRSVDAIKHGNLAGTSPLGGVVLLAGDDHGAKSSSTAHQSEQVFEACAVPVFNPGSVSEYRDMLPVAVALSRFAGVWTGFKVVTEIVEASATVDRAHIVPDFILPEVEAPAGGYHIGNRFMPLAFEESLYRYRLPAARAFLAANSLDRVIMDAPTRALGIVVTGKAAVDLEEALRLLDIDADMARQMGLRVLRPMVTWPLDEVAAHAFCAGHREICVVEEKRDFVERQIANLLARSGDARRPALSGKTTPEGEPLLPDYGELSAPAVALALASRLAALGLANETVRTAAARIQEDVGVSRPGGPSMRLPMFCSGCPHNRSTRIPEGSQALGGIGCHGIATLIPELNTMPSVHMGGEGANWIGIEPFAGPEHIFQNMGDGTYAHSGLLAIRAAVAARSNITYKILCNSAVAMTGGQPVEGSPDAGAIARQLHAEGLERVILVSEDPLKFPGLPAGIELLHRDALMDAQDRLKAIPGVTALVYDQGCAAERRRLRKKGAYPDLPIRTFINSDVCEGCGDCNAKSSCVSVLPIDTELGVKRAIEQESCNKDYTCVEGFCPSFVTVKGGKPRTTSTNPDLLERLEAHLAEPGRAAQTEEGFNIVLAGIGGTGIISLGATLGRAAEMDGQTVLTFDVTGVSQKNGAVFSHVRLLGDADPARFRPRIPRSQLDLLIGCDIMAATAAEVMPMTRPGRTEAVVNSDLVPTADFQRNPRFDRSADRFLTVLHQTLGEPAVFAARTDAAVDAIVGKGPLLNLYLLGVACQRGLLPLSLAALEAAVGGGRGGNRNLAAFRMGRLAVHDPSALAALLETDIVEATPLAELRLDALIARAKEILTSYQNLRYADIYEEFVRVVAARDPAEDFTRAVALNLFKLMRYKDEYEVARLYAAPEFRRRIKAAFEGDVTLQFNLAPPLLTHAPDGAEPRKLRFGGWMMTGFRFLQHFKFLRGTAFDPFGRGEDRKLERALITEYRTTVEDIVGRIDRVDYRTAVAIAALPDGIRGYGPVKTRSVAAAHSQQVELMRTLEKPVREVAA